MRNRDRSFAGLVVVIAGLAVQPAWGDQTPWWNRQWPWRRAVLAEPPKTPWPGADVCHVVLPTHGVVGRSAPSVRVVTAGGKETPHQIMERGPGDRLRLCFAMLPIAKKYFVYYGNQDAEPADANWRPQRGLVLTGWKYRGGAIGDLAQTRETFGKAEPLQGMRFVPNVFLGHNPFGPTGDTCHKYEGWLICPYTGSYVFATSSDDASFLLIDDEQVVAWPGQHRWRADAKHQGTAELTEDVHKFTYYHVNVGRYGGAVAAWQPPGKKKITVIPPGSFAPVVEGRLGDLDHVGRRFQADFDLEQVGEAFFADRHSYRYRFAAKVPRPSPNVRFAWDFGDGTTSRQRDPEHVYLRPGRYRVALAVETVRQTSKISNRLAVRRDWDRVVDERPDATAVHARIVSDYPFEAMAAADLGVAVQLLRRAGEWDRCLAAGRAMIDRCNELKPKQLAPYFDELIQAAQGLSSDPQRAVELCHRLERASKGPFVRAHACAVEGGLWLARDGDLQKAEEAFQRVLDEYAERASSDDVRRARIGLGDVARQRGDLASAERHYHAAERLGQAGQQLAKRGHFARAIEDYTRRGELTAAEELLKQWEWDCPTDKLTGAATLWRARFLLADGRRGEAAEEARALVEVNPHSVYAPELLLLIADVELAGGRAEQARQSLERILREHPTSSLRAQAVELLAGIESGDGGSREQDQQMNGRD